MKFPRPASGKMLEHKFKAKDVVPVGEVIAILELSGEKGISEKLFKKGFRKNGFKKRNYRKTPSYH